MLLRKEPGWSGVFGRGQAKGAFPNGSRVIKVKAEPGDAHPVGTHATVLGSIGAGSLMGYFLEWDPNPRQAVFVVDWKIALESENSSNT